MNEITTWGYGSSEVRTIQQNGETWFVLKDVCAVLEMGSNRAGEVTKRLDEDEYDSIGLTDLLGREQKTYIINESGLYTVILRSDKPQAKPFRKWVTSEVLPAIRKHGMYATDELLANDKIWRTEEKHRKAMVENSALVQKLNGEIARLKELLDIEQEWQPVEDTGTNLDQMLYVGLRDSDAAEALTDNETLDFSHLPMWTVMTDFMTAHSRSRTGFLV